MTAAIPLLLRAGARAAVAWKNGGGVTREVAAHPPGSDLDSFEWRVSIAEVNCGGPFSSFAGVDRRMAVLAGTLELVIAGREALVLSAESAPVAFPGDVAVTAAPRGAAVTDLNVMTRRGRCDARLARRTAGSPVQLALHADTVLVIALADLALRCAGAEHALGRLDAARFEGATRCQIVPREAQAAFYLVELRNL